MPPQDFSRPAAWKDEVSRSVSLAETYWPAWQDNVNSYIGQNTDAESANNAGTNFVNVNADFKNVEVKMPQLFFDTPELQLAVKGQFSAPPPAQAIPGAPPQPTPDPGAIIAAHRELMNELLGPDGTDVLQTVKKVLIP